MNTYIANAFSISMLGDIDQASIQIQKINKNDFYKTIKTNNAVSCVGHKDTAQVLGVDFNRTNINLKQGDVLLVAQLNGGRLPEGATTLPDGFSFTYYKIQI